MTEPGKIEIDKDLLNYVESYIVTHMLAGVMPHREIAKEVIKAVRGYKKGFIFKSNEDKL